MRLESGAVPPLSEDTNTPGRKHYLHLIVVNLESEMGLSKCLAKQSNSLLLELAFGMIAQSECREAESRRWRQRLGIAALFFPIALNILKNSNEYSIAAANLRAARKRFSSLP